MSDTTVAERRKCVMCGETATKQVPAREPSYAIRRYSDAFVERPFIPMEVTIPQDFCVTHFNDVHVLGTRKVGFCSRCKAWRAAGGGCPKCGSALLGFDGAHRWGSL